MAQKIVQFFPQTWAKAILKFHTVNIQWVLDDIYTHFHTAVIVTPVCLKAKSADRIQNENYIVQQ
jgi:hypothetical protein